MISVVVNPKQLFRLGLHVVQDFSASTVFAFAKRIRNIYRPDDRHDMRANLQYQDYVHSLVV